MKTTIEIGDALLEEAKQAAREAGSTLRELVEEGLRAVLQKRSQDKPEFRLRDARFKGTGEGLQPPFEDGRWDEIRTAAYRGRGA